MAEGRDAGYPACARVALEGREPVPTSETLVPGPALGTE